MGEWIQCCDCGDEVHINDADCIRGHWLCNECYEDWMSYE